MAPRLKSYNINSEGITELVIENLYKIESTYTEGVTMELYVVVDTDKGVNSKVTVFGLESYKSADIELREFTSLGLNKLEEDTMPTCYYAKISGYLDNTVELSNIFSK